MKASDFELLLPVGQKEMAEAAIQNGADAIYLGFPGFNARGRSYDFELEELRQIIELCHLNGVKVNLAFNIVIFETELAQVVESIKQVLPLKPDALIVQDLGLVRLIKTMCPDQTVHASTQMTVTNDLAIDFLQDLGIRRFVLGRENSLSEIKLIAERTRKELEVFVHGALCVSYSGQCFTSETLGGRSANRGQCAQSCRFSYDLIVDGEKKNLVDRTYLVSPQDLCGIAEIPELMKLGVKSFKIEGRLKSPAYVAQAAKSFRRAIDQALEQTPLNEAEIQSEKNKMGVEYSRGFFPGWLHGVNHQELVDGTFSSHRGVPLGTVQSVSRNQMEIVLRAQPVEIENGDGVAWFEKGQKKGAPVFGVRRNPKAFVLEFSNSTEIDASAVGSLVYLNHDRSQKKEIEKSLTDKALMKKIPVQVTLSLCQGRPLVAEIRDDRFCLKFASESLLVKAEKKPLSEDFLFEEFSSLGGTLFHLNRTDFKAELPPEVGLFLNHKEIKTLRQKAFAELARLRRENKIEKAGGVQVMDFEWPSPRNAERVSRVGLNVLLRNKEQVNHLTRALTEGRFEAGDLRSVCLDFEFGRDYQSSVGILRAAGLPVGIATTRILKPQEYINLKVIHSLNPDFILCRNLGAVRYFKNIQPFAGELKGDFSLNVTNHLTFDYLISQGLESLCLSYDLNVDQTLSLLKNVDASRAEMTIHQSMPSFHMEHCVFAAFLSKGKSFRDCGKPCEKHQVQLKDQFGNTHWIKPDQECRNTMYNASAQTALPYLEDWKALGLGQVRFEALHEEGEELLKKIGNYIDVLQGRKSLGEALRELQTSEIYGLSPRQLERSEEYRARKKDHRFL
jgi:putative protease